MNQVEMSVVVPVRRAPRTAVNTITELLKRSWKDGLEVIAVVSTSDPTSLLLRRWWFRCAARPDSCGNAFLIS